MPQGGADFHPPPSLSGVSDDPPGSPAETPSTPTDKSRTCFMCLSTQTEPKFPLLFWNRMFTITTMCIREESCFNTLFPCMNYRCVFFLTSPWLRHSSSSSSEPQPAAGLADI
ncbi:hypothetical protein ILYODFUR_008727 [Ilyodon furcidens]|uniref:Uncharacterized protein n=1 Tax=Ilyodon furcidens TaxID=33524 RepID=A0ABV0VDP5_9TELE